MDYIKTPCKHCPFRHDVKPFLHPRRAEELAYAAQNPYEQFPCHKTTEYNDEYDNEYGGNDMMQVETSKECAGFLTLRAQMNGDEVPEGFEPAYDLCYEDDWDMIQAYEEQWENDHS